MPKAAHATGEEETVNTRKGVYKPTPKQEKNQKKDRLAIDKALRYRSQFEGAWRHNAEKWNQVAPEGLEGTPNYVVPISRLATHTGIVSMRQSLPGIRVVPEGADEKKLGYIIGEASEHVHRMSNMEGVMDQAIVDYAVLGNMVLESYVSVPYESYPAPVLDEYGNETGEYETVYKRDWSQPKIGTRARSPWECAFDPGARTPDKIRYCWFQDRLSPEEFDEQYRNMPDNDFINLDCVKPGVVYTFGAGGELERSDTKRDEIIIDHVQYQGGMWRKYANGVLIHEIPLKSVHVHGKITLSLIPNHHKYDGNLKTHALYGAGDPELLSDLDDLINAITNMFVLNYRQKNTYVVGIEGAGDVDEIDFSTGSPVKGKVTVQSLGAADLPEWAEFKNHLEEWAIQIVKKNYRRLEGEVAKTAYEAAQKKSDENKGMEYQTKRMEAGGLLEYMKKHISDTLEHLPVEEWEDVLDGDREAVKALYDAKELGKADVVMKKVKGKLVPIKVRYVEKIRTRGKVFREGYDGKGNRNLGELQELKKLRGQDGWLSASGEYLWPKSWRLFKRVPDIYLVGKTILGQDDLMELGKIEQLIGILERIGNLQSLEEQGGASTGTDYDKLQDAAYDKIGLRREDFKTTEGEDRTAKTRESIKKAKEMQNQLLNPRLHAKAQLAAQGPQPVQAPVRGQAPQPGGRAAAQAPQGGDRRQLGGAA